MIAARFLWSVLLAATLGGAPESIPCPVTQPATPLFMPPAAYQPQPDPRASFFPEKASTFWYGTPEFWTRLHTSGAFGRRDKLFWWYPGYNGAVEQHPNLAISIKPFGSGVTVATEARPTNAYFGGAWSMLTMLEFPEPGCWEVTGAYGGHKLTFVTAVP